MNSRKSLDVVIPVYNEAVVLSDLFHRLDEVFSQKNLEASGLDAVRFVMIDDGSGDETPALISAKIESGWPATLVCLSRNFGHQAAITAGLDLATASFVAVMDADLQDPPELLLDMVRRLESGLDVVYAQRKTRQESIIKKIPYWIFYRLIRAISDVPMPVDAGDFCVMRQEFVQAMRQLPEGLRFHRGLRSWVGFRQAAHPYDRPPRARGETRYTWGKLYKLATDGVASVSIRPLRITQVLLFFSMIATLAFITISTVVYLRLPNSDAHLIWFLTTQGLVALTSSLQLFCLYILGSYIGRMYLEVKARPSYIVAKKVGIASAPKP